MADIDFEAYSMTEVEGGVTTPAGVLASAVHGGFRKDPNRLDVAMVSVEGDNIVSAGTFTRNVFCAAPVQISRAALERGHGKAVIINSGNANAATGEHGRETARKSQQIAAQALGIASEDMLVASTGVIGVQLDIAPFEQAAPQLVEKLSSEGGHDAACAIMTTDTHPKECAVEIKTPAGIYHIGAMCKGSGMIQPNMATMLCVITSDVKLAKGLAKPLLLEAVDASFNKITVDSDTSTNDSVFFFANGASGIDVSDEESLEHFQFRKALRYVCESLARQIAQDGEGATKLVTVLVEGAVDDKQAETAARTIANSPLVKTAIAGHDCNWGRIAAALGRSGIDFEQEKTDIEIMGMPVCRDGLAVEFSEEEALKRFEQDEIVILVNVHAGKGRARIWTCDLTHEYIHINADYRS